MGVLPAFHSNPNVAVKTKELPTVGTDDWPGDDGGGGTAINIEAAGVLTVAPMAMGMGLNLFGSRADNETEACVVCVGRL
jgi:hypothetical protein